MHDLRPYLSYEFQSQTAEPLSFLGFLRLRISTIFRRLSLTALPQWVHFSVERGAGHELMGQNSLNITAIIAAVEHVPNPQEEGGMNWNNIFWDESGTIRLHVAADQGTNCLRFSCVVCR